MQQSHPIHVDITLPAGAEMGDGPDGQSYYEFMLGWMGDWWAGQDNCSPFTWGLGLPNDYPLRDGREPQS